MIKVAELCVDDCFLDAVEYIHGSFFELDMSILRDIGVDKVPNQHAWIRFYRQAFYLNVPVAMVCH